MKDRIRRNPVATIFVILAALSVLGIAASQSVFVFTDANYNIEYAIVKAQAIETAVKHYHLNNGFFPASLDDVTPHLTEGQYAIVDPWGQPYEFMIEEGRAIIWTTSPKGERIQWPRK